MVRKTDDSRTPVVQGDARWRERMWAPSPRPTTGPRVAPATVSTQPRQRAVSRRKRRFAGARCVANPWTVGTSGSVEAGGGQPPSATRPVPPWQARAGTSPGTSPPLRIVPYEQAGRSMWAVGSDCASDALRRQAAGPRRSVPVPPLPTARTGNQLETRVRFRPGSM